LTPGVAALWIERRALNYEYRGTMNIVAQGFDMLKIARMRIPVFVSAPSPDNLSSKQEQSAIIIQKLVVRYKLEWRALGRSDYPNDLPLKEVLRMVRHCSGGMILGFEQFRATRGEFKSGSRNAKVANSVVWCLFPRPGTNLRPVSCSAPGYQ
jgi:hypothetical protein